ncbi:negative regulation of motor neuron migration [Mactra antiquata]
MPVENIQNIKDKLQVVENGYRFSSSGHCDVCETHINQLKQEAVSMVHSIHQAQTDFTSATNIPNLIGSVNVNLPPQSPRKIGSTHNSYLR